MGASEVSHSVRLGKDGVQNITQRDSKRPKERTRDQVYKKRFSMGSSVPCYGSPQEIRLPVGNRPWPREAGFSSPSPQPVMVFNYGLAPSPGSPRGPPMGPTRVAVPPGPPRDPSYVIHLIFEGAVVACRVRSSMLIAQLAVEAGQIFGLDPEHVILMLFSAAPTSLPKDGCLSGPPVVGPGSRVMVF